MGKPSRKTTRSTEEGIVSLRRESDMSRDEISEEDSEMSIDSYISSDAYSDQDWEPDTKRPRGAEQQDNTSSEEEPHPPTTQRGSASSRRPRGRGRGWRGMRSSEARLLTSTTEESWNDIDVQDIMPPLPTFRPTHPPGPKLICTTTYTALQLFQLYFTNSTLQTIIKNTNDFGSAHSKPYAPWINLTLQDMFSFMSLVVYFGIVKCRSFTDYWRGGKLYSMSFPKHVMSGKKFFKIVRSLHLNSMVADAANELKRGTAAFDKLAKIKPLYEEIKEACKRNYHPGQEISIDERMVATKSRIGIKQYMKNKPVRWGYKLFVLADSSNGYTWDFSVYEGKSKGNSGNGLGYDSVMDLIQPQLLGTGYKLFVDNFYTSATLFRMLLEKRIWACGTLRANSSSFPKTNRNLLVSKSPRGSIRWIRKDSLLFVQWRDTRDVFMCSTLHTAHGLETTQRRVKGADGQWTFKDVPVPPAVIEYNRCMGGVDLSDALIGYYTVLHKTMRWYKTFFYHFMDIAIVNAYLLHKDLAKGKGQVPMTHKAFREALAEELAAVGSPSTTKPNPPRAPRGAHHRPVHISGDSTAGRLRCRHCHQKTPVKCSSCDEALCFVAGRDCYNDWHVANNL
ncbi:piggyBac transposable element-derived protein 4 [Clinocottus analis]|uniref:piggyBac transposable element-derived protein 4 n=1 Tax=Clinocottus analis TaxID=304258 RepID=UPI0035C04CEF